jgi:hypothetical protein
MPPFSSAGEFALVFRGEQFQLRIYMKILCAMLVTAGISASTAYGAWVVDARALACTQDYNEWGHGSSCGCPEATQYNQKIGRCLQGEAYPIRVQGVLHSGVTATGGETTGIELETKFGRFELIAKLADIAKLQKANGLTFEVSGEFLLMPGVEARRRSVILVDELNWLE